MSEMRYFDATRETREGREKEKLCYFPFTLPSRFSRVVPKPATNVVQATVRIECVFPIFRWA